MKPGEVRVVFIGTPEFAVPSLDAILHAGYRVVGVITSPDKPSGRGLKLQSSPVKQFAEQKNLRILQPPNLKNEAFLEELRSLKADVQVVIAFRMLPEAVWNMPPNGTINLHASLLPNYRGAAPINRAIMNGEKETGLTTFKLRHAIDTGDLLLQKKVAIASDETAGELHDRLMHIGANVVVETLNGLFAGSLASTKQEVKPEHRQAPKIFKEDCFIHWEDQVESIRNQIRGLSPYPAARCMFADKQLKIFSARIEITKTGQTPGHHEILQETVRFAGLDGWVYPLEVQLEGKKSMPIADFLRGLQ